MAEWHAINPADVPKDVQEAVASGIYPDRISIKISPVAKPGERWTVYVRDHGQWWKVFPESGERELFYKESRAVLTQRHPPKKYQLSIFDALEHGIPAAKEKFELEFKPHELTVPQIKAVGAVEKMFEKRNWDRAYGAGYVEYHESGPFNYDGSVPNLRFPVTEALQEAGIPKWKRKDGRRVYRSKERDRLIKAIRDLAQKQWDWWVEEKTKDGQSRITREYGWTYWKMKEVTEKMYPGEKADYLSGRSTRKVKWFELTPNPAFFVGIKTNRGMLSDGKADYLLKPWTLYEKLTEANPHAVKENIDLMNFLLKTLAERHGKSFAITRTDRELARVLGWYGRIEAKAWKAIRRSLEKRAKDLIKAGYLKSYRLDGPDSRGVWKFTFNLNPATCTYQKADVAEA